MKKNILEKIQIEKNELLPLNYYYVKIIKGKKRVNENRNEYYSCTSFICQKYYKSIIKL